MNQEKNESIDEREKLNIDDVFTNLHIICCLNSNEQLIIIDKKYIQIDKRYFLGIRRYLNDDDRYKSVDFIECVINDCRFYCDEAVKNINNNINKQENLTKLIKLHSYLLFSINGLSKMEETYNSDKLVIAKIENIKNNINSLCNQDLNNISKEIINSSCFNNNSNIPIIKNSVPSLVKNLT